MTERDENGRFVKGQSGNPNGRQKKGQTLTDLLDLQFRKIIIDHDGKKRSGKRVFARIAVEAVTTGRLRFTVESPTGELMTVTKKLEPREWMTWAKCIYDRIDGPPVQRNEITGAHGGPMEVQRIELTDDEIAAQITAILDTARARRDRELANVELA